MPRQFRYLVAAVVAVLALLALSGLFQGQRAVTPPAPLAPPPVGTPGRNPTRLTVSARGLPV